MFRIGFFTGRVYEDDKTSLKDIHECCAQVQEEQRDYIDDIAQTLHEKCDGCHGCEESRKKKA